MEANTVKYEDSTIFNCHTHVFTNRNVPGNALGFPLLMDIIRNKSYAKILSTILRNILPFKSNDFFDKLSAFCAVSALDSQKEVFEFLRQFYPEKTCFVALPMDMAKMGAGDIEESYKDQLAGIQEIRAELPQTFLPFIFADPRREGITNLVKNGIENGEYSGIKIYPSLGYYPDYDFDNKGGLYRIFEFAERNQIPITAHCQRGYMYSRSPIPKGGRGVFYEKYGKYPGSKKEYWGSYNDPDNYEKVLDEFNELKINFAHFGGAQEWKYYMGTRWPSSKPQKSWVMKIVELMKKRENVYTDIAVMMRGKTMLDMLNILLEGKTASDRILFGTDFYMVTRTDSETAYTMGIRKVIGEEKWKKISNINPRRFLTSNCLNFQSKNKT
jgi:uncharacterized protein